MTKLLDSTLVLCDLDHLLLAGDGNMPQVSAGAARRSPPSTAQTARGERWLKTVSLPPRLENSWSTSRTTCGILPSPAKRRWSKSQSTSAESRSFVIQSPS